MLMQNLAGQTRCKMGCARGESASFLTFYLASPAGVGLGGGGGVLVGCYLINFYTRRIRPKVQPLTLYIPFLTEKVSLWSTLY